MSLDHNFLAEEQIKPLVEDASAYIQKQRQKFLGAAEPISVNDKSWLRPFFPSWTLDMARFSGVGNWDLEQPAFLTALNEHGFSYPNLNTMYAVTFRDVVVLMKNLMPEILFHELVHVVQYQKLGLGGFADRYVRGLLRAGGYMFIPLEIHAYQLGERYLKNPSAHFSVEKEVDEWIGRGLY